MAKIKRNIRATAEFTLSSMSDIAFLLIVFFLVTSMFLLKDGIHLSMPDKSRTPVLIPGDKILTIEYRKDGNIYLKNKQTGFEALRIELEKQKGTGSGKVILLKISGELPYEKAVSLIDTVKASGETRFSVRMI